MAKRKHLINVHTSTGTTAPTGASLYLGEIAVQHKANDPALWIKVGAAESSTQYEKFVGEKAVTSAISQAVSSSLTGVSMNGSEVSVANNVAALGTVITAETQLSTATTGTGNVVGSIAVSNHKITSTMFSAASADQISKLSGATQSHTANTTVHTTDAEKTRWNNAWTSGISAYTKVEVLSAATTGISKNLTDLSAVTITGVTQNGTSVVSNKVAAIVETSVSTANGSTSNTPAAVVTGITTGGTKGHELTLAKTNKVFSAATSDSALTVLSAVTSLSAQTAILGPNYTYSGISYVNSATSVADAYSALTNEMINDEKVISAAFNDLNTRVNEISAATHGQGGIESITLNGDEYTGTSVNLGTVVRTETQLSKGTTTGTGNVVTDLSVSNHQITLAKSFSAAPADQFVTLSGAAHNKITALSSATVAHINSAASHVSATDRTTWNGKQDAISDLGTIRNNALSGASAYTRVNALSAATTAHTANTTVHVTAANKTLWNAAITGVTSAGTGNAFTDYSVSGNKLTLTKGATYLTTAATTTQGGYADSALQIVSGSTYIEMSAKSGGNGAKMQTATVKQQGVETASATGQGLADAYDVKQYVEGLVTSSVNYKGATATLPTSSTQGDMYITTAQIVLTASQSATGAAQTAETGDFIIARSSGKWDVIQKNLDGAITGSLTADTVTLGSGTHTAKSLANGSNGQVLAVVSNKPAWTSAVKVNSATTADSATNATNATNATSATTSLSANVATNATKVNNHTVNSDVPTNAVFTDTATTKDGHYDPGLTATTAGTSAEGGFIKTVKLDGKGHVTGTTTGTAITAETQLSYSSGSSVSNTASAVVTGLTVSNHAITYGKTNKVFSAGTADSAATLTGNITTGQVTDLAATIKATKVNSATTADSASNAAKVNNHTVESDVPSSAVFTDTATTQTGHYTPSASASTEGSTTGFIKQIKLDSKKHVVGIVSGTTSYTETSVTTKNGTTGSTAAPVLSNITTGGTKGHELTLTYTNKVNSATTANSAVTSTSAITSQSANTSAALTGNITTGQVTSLASTIQATKVNSATTADSATNATKVNNHTVNSDVPANAVFTDTKVTAVGNHYTATTATKTGGTTTTSADWAVKGITYDAAGHIVGVISGSVLTSASDTATTEGGHYSPSTSASTKGTTAATTNFVKGIRIDSKNHVIDVVTGAVLTAETLTGVSTVGTAIALTNKVANIPSASSSTFGVVKVPATSTSFITNSNGSISVATGSTSATVARGDHNHNGVYATTGSVNDLSAVTLTGVSVVGTALPVSNHVVNVPSASSTAFGVVKAGTFLTSTNGTLSVSTGTSNTTVAVGNHTHSNYATTTDLNALSAATTAHTGNNNIHVTSAEKTAWTNGANSGASAYTRVNELSAATVGISAKTAHMLTMQLNGTQVGQYSPSANTTINMKVDGTNVMLTSAYTMNTGTSRVALEVTSADSTTEAFGKVSKVIYLDELITSSALNDLNDRVYELEQGGGAASEDLLELSGVVIDFETEVAQDIAEINERIDNLGGGELSSAYTMATGSTEQQLSLHSGDTFEVAFGKMEKREYDNELAFAAALNVLNSNINTHTADTTVHVTAAEKSTWNGKQDTISDIATIRNNATSGAAAYTNVNALSAATTAINQTLTTVSGAAHSKITSLSAATTAHTADTTVHVTSAEKTRIDDALQIVSGSTYIETSSKTGSAGSKIQTVSAKQHGVETATATGQGLADAYDVKQYVEGLITSSVNYLGGTATVPSTSSTGDLYVMTATIVLNSSQSATGAAQTAETGDFIIARSTGKWDVIQKNLDGAITGTLTLETLVLGDGVHTAKSLANGSSGQVLIASNNTSHTPAWGNISLDMVQDGSTRKLSDYATTANLNTHTGTTISGRTSGQIHLPTVSSSDNGKILRVVNGVWTLVNPTTVLTGSGAPSSTLGENGDIYLQS